MTETNYLELRKKIKAKKPKFIRQDAHKKAEISKNWRKPKGIQSKMRLNKRGYRKSVTPGYGSPKKAYGLHPTGLKPILTSSLKDIENLNPKTEGILISGTVGLKKKLDIIKIAKEKNIKILNIKEADQFIKQAEELISKKKESKKTKEEERNKKKKEAETKNKEKNKENLDEKLTDEEKKDQEKKEKDKVLTKKGA